MGSSKEEKREKKGRKEQGGGQDKDNQPVVGWSKPSPQMASPPSQTSLCCGSMWHPVLLSGPARAQSGPDLPLPSTHTHTHAYYE